MMTWQEKEEARIAERKVIKAYCNHAMYSDTQPYEVVEVRTPNKVMIRAMEAEKAEWAEEPIFIPGGFSGTFVNQDKQRWKITSDESNPLVAVRWSKRNARWQDAHGNRYFMCDEPVKFYDYNF